MHHLQALQQTNKLQVQNQSQEDQNNSQGEKDKQRKKKRWGYRVGQKAKKIYNSSFWKLEENVCYMQFLVQNQQLFYTSNQNRKNIQINVLMSKAVKTRSSEQCRSHHQKMIQYHLNISGVIRHIKGLMSEKNQQIVIQNCQQSGNQEMASLRKEDQFQMLNFSLFGCFKDLKSELNFRQEQQQKEDFQKWYYGVQDKYGNLESKMVSALNIQYIRL